MTSALFSLVVLLLSSAAAHFMIKKSRRFPARKDLRHAGSRWRNKCVAVDVFDSAVIAIFAEHSTPPASDTIISRTHQSA
jgi:hypothetical protein